MPKITPLHRVRRKIRNRDSSFHPSNDTYKWWVLANVMIGTFMAVLDATIVNVGLPKIMASFGVGLDKIEWVLTAYLLALAVMLPTSAWLADKFGHKRMYFYGLLFFTLGSFLCGMSPDENILIVSRIIQGMGAGMLMPIGMAIITREFPPNQRGIAIGFWSIAAAASVSFGPIIGGYLVDTFNWSLIFDVNVPVGIVGLIVTVIIQKEYINKKARKFDLVGFISVATFLPLVLFALSEGSASTNTAGWHAPYIIICFAISFVALAIFITNELIIDEPLIELRLLVNRNFGISNIIIFIFGMGMFGSTFLMPLYLQNSLGYTALQAGAVFLPVGIIQGIAAPMAGILADRINPKIPIIIGVILMALSFYLNSYLSYLTEHSYIMLSLYLRGLGMGIMFTPLSTVALLEVPREKMAQASGLLNTIRQLAGSFGVALMATVLSTRIKFHAQIYGEGLNNTSPIFNSITHQMAMQLQHHVGSTMAEASQQVRIVLASFLAKQATVQGVNDDFLIAALITIVGLVPIIWLHTKKKRNIQKKQLVMNSKINRVKETIIILFSGFLPFMQSPLWADTTNVNKTDTLQLSEAIHQALATHPSIEIAIEALKAAVDKISLSQSGYYPNFDISASYSRIGPAPSIPFNGQNFQLFPNNNYDADLNYSQNIYDFGRTSSRVALEKENKEVSSENIDVVKQQLSQRVIQTYYSILFLQEALKIEDTQIKALEDHYEFIKKKQETGSATSYEVLSTQVKLSEVKNQKLDIAATWQTLITVMNALLGNPENTSYFIINNVQVNPEPLLQDTAVMRALKNRREMQIAFENEKLANMRLKIARADYNPEIRAFASAGGKNGYVGTKNSDLNKVKLNYVAGIGLSIPLYEGSRNKNNVELAQVSIDNSKYDTELTRRKITTEVVNYYQLEQASQKKIDEYKLQYEMADEAYKLAETSYNDGAITNLDLLYASTALAQSQLELLKSRIDYLVNMYNLKIAMGETIEGATP